MYVCVLCAHWPFNKWCNRLVYCVSFLWIKASIWMNRSIPTRFTSVTFSLSKCEWCSPVQNFLPQCWNVFDCVCAFLVQRILWCYCTHYSHPQHGFICLFPDSWEIWSLSHRQQSRSTGVNRCSFHMAEWTPDLDSSRGQRPNDIVKTHQT